jgi:hypothetical protein
MPVPHCNLLQNGGMSGVDFSFSVQIITFNPWNMYMYMTVYFGQIVIGKWVFNKSVKSLIFVKIGML